MIGSSKNATVIVEAIEEGRIVRVPESYAVSEGLLILRRPQISLVESTLKMKCADGRDARHNKGSFLSFDEFRKPMKKEESEVLKELVDNFHWVLVQKRKARGLTRKQVAEAICETENNIKMMENGVLPLNNFIMINKLESYYGLSLRKGGKSASSVSLSSLSKPSEGFKGFNAIKKEKGQTGESKIGEREKASNAGEAGKNANKEDMAGDDLLLELED